VTNVTSRGNRKDGIFVLSGMDVGLVNNELQDNANGIVIQGGDNLRLLNNQGNGNTQVGFDVSGDATNVSLTSNTSKGGAQRAAFRTVGPAGVTFASNRAKGFKGFGFQFADAPSVTDDGGNKANGKPSKACFSDSGACPLKLK
jgi:parallel beta-helix repeat protein